MKPHARVREPDSIKIDDEGDPNLKILTIWIQTMVEFSAPDVCWNVVVERLMELSREFSPRIVGY